MRKFAVLLMTVFFCLSAFAQLGAVDLNSGKDTPNYFSSVGNSCPHPLNCTYGTNFVSLSEANRCGCCSCHGGAVGCAGGSQGQIVCGDGTYAQGCSCQYLVNS